jgi:hypothetical protein
MLVPGTPQEPARRQDEQDRTLRELKKETEETNVPLCLKSLLRENKKYLADSKTVVAVMHKFGLGSRYLGSLHRRALS